MIRKSILPTAFIVCAFLAMAMIVCDSEEYEIIDDIAMVDNTVALSWEDSAAWARKLFPGREYDCGSPVNNVNPNVSHSGICGGIDDPLRRGALRGVVYNTVVNEDSIDVRSSPAHGGVLFQVHKNTQVQIIGISNESSLGANGEYWVKVRIKADSDPGVWSPLLEPHRGTPPPPQENGWLPDGDYWIFSKFINYENGDRLVPVEMEVVIIDGELTGIYEIDGEKRFAGLRGHRHKGADADAGYSVFYSPHAEGAHYRLIPGSYRWQPNTGMFKHVSYDVQFCHVHGIPGPSMVR